MVSGLGLRVFNQCLDVSLDRGERRAQFVADVGDEFAAGFLCSLNAGDVVKNDERATGRQGSRIDFEDAAGSEQTGAANAHSRASSAPGRRPAVQDRERSEPADGLAEFQYPPYAASRRWTSAPGLQPLMATTASCMESSMAASS